MFFVPLVIVSVTGMCTSAESPESSTVTAKPRLVPATTGCGDELWVESSVPCGRAFVETMFVPCRPPTVGETLAPRRRVTTAPRPAAVKKSGEFTKPIAAFIAGQTALDNHGDLVGKGDFEAQADQVFRNISAAVASVGCTTRNLAKLTVFVRDMGELAAYRRARNRFFATVTPPAAPAVTLVEVSKLYGPDFLIEIEAVAASAT